MGKRGQLSLSFGMIFSIILIVIFIAVAIYAIIKFVGIQQMVQIEKFKIDLQEDITKMWQGPGGDSQEVSYYLPKKIDAFCFDGEDWYLESDTGIIGYEIEHLDTSELSRDFCINTIDGKVSMVLSKDYGEILVKITG